LATYVSSDPLGLEGDTLYQSQTLPVGAGDTFLLFTDGLVEAPGSGDQEGEEFGEERLRQAVRSQPHADVNRLTQSILDELRTWIGGVPLPDDLCLVAVEAVGSTPALPAST